MVPMSDLPAPTSHPAPTTTRERIPVVALQLFAEKGYEATSMREIAEHLGITKPALYYHFDSKEAIVRELLRELLGQVAELVSWVQGRKVTARLRREVLLRWSDIMQAHGLALFRFMMANRRVIHDLHHHNDNGQQDMMSLVEQLHRLLAPPKATVEAQLRVRMALMSINMAGMAGVDIDAPDEEILTAARKVALDLLP
jgi:AcrR family transcriptional regulator